MQWLKYALRKAEVWVEWQKCWECLQERIEAKKKKKTLCICQSVRIIKWMVSSMWVFSFLVVSTHLQLLCNSWVWFTLIQNPPEEPEKLYDTAWSLSPSLPHQLHAVMQDQPGLWKGLKVWFIQRLQRVLCHSRALRGGRMERLAVRWECLCWRNWFPLGVMRPKSI